MTIPDEAETARGAALDAVLRLAESDEDASWEKVTDAAMEAAAPLIAAAERQRIRQLAIERGATYIDECTHSGECARQHIGPPHTHQQVPFADLLDTP